MYTYNRKKEIINNVIYVSVILLIAVFSTYHIYHKFQDVRNVAVPSESLDVTYHEASGNKISITKVTPVTDSVGLSSKSYNISIKNNLTEKNYYKVLLKDDLEEIENDECKDDLIPKEDIRVSIKVGKNDNIIYSLNEIKDGILLEDTVKALDTAHLSIRMWVQQDSVIPMGSNMHYHGVLSILEDNSSLNG